jgi:hypothetical protein
MVSNLLKRWRDDFSTVKRQGDGFGAFQKETGCHPGSSHPTSSTGHKYVEYVSQMSGIFYIEGSGYFSIFFLSFTYLWFKAVE